MSHGSGTIQATLAGSLTNISCNGQWEILHTWKQAVDNMRRRYVIWKQIK